MPDALATLNDAIRARGELNNSKTEMLIKTLSEDPLYQMEPAEKKKTEFYRHGFCGEACDAVLDTLAKQGISIDSFSKIRPNPDHIYLADKESDVIIDPTFKQFLYRLLIDTNTDNLKDTITEQQVKIIDAMQPIFIGTLSELKLQISFALTKLNKEADIPHVLAVWNIPSQTQDQTDSTVPTVITPVSEELSQPLLNAHTKEKDIASIEHNEASASDRGTYTPPPLVFNVETYVSELYEVIEQLKREYPTEQFTGELQALENLLQIVESHLTPTEIPKLISNFFKQHPTALAMQPIVDFWHVAHEQANHSLCFDSSSDTRPTPIDSSPINDESAEESSGSERNEDDFPFD